jgi:hypothetical protein
MHDTFPAHLILLDFITLIISGDRKIYEAPRYAVSRAYRHSIPLTSEHTPQHPVLVHPESVFVAHV